MLTKCAAVDVAPFGIRVNAVNPGGIYIYIFKKCKIIVFIMLTKCAAVDVAPFGIRVNAVNPGGLSLFLYR